MRSSDTDDMVFLTVVKSSASQCRTQLRKNDGSHRKLSCPPRCNTTEHMGSTLRVKFQLGWRHRSWTPPIVNNFSKVLTKHYTLASTMPKSDSSLCEWIEDSLSAKRPSGTDPTSLQVTVAVLVPLTEAERFRLRDSSMEKRHPILAALSQHC